MSGIVSGLFGAIVAAALVSLSERKQKAARITSDGWRTLSAGWLANTTIILCAYFSCLTAYFLLNGGSRRPDADIQNISSVTLLLISLLGGCYTAWSVYGRRISWKGNQLRLRTAFGHQMVQKFSDVTSAQRSDWRGEYRLNFKNGTSLWVSVHMNGAQDLLARVPERAFGR